MFASVFVLLILVGSASAVSVSPDSKVLEKTTGSHSFNVTLENTTINEPVNLSINNIESISFSVSQSNLLLTGSKIVTVSYNIPSNFDFDFSKDYSTNLIVEGNNTINVPISFEDSFCNFANPGNLRVDIKDMSVIEGLGKDDEWFPLDKVEVEVKVQNNGNEKIQDISLEWGLYDESNNQWAIEIDEEDNFNLKDDDDNTITFSFVLNKDLDIDVEDLEDGTYTLYVRATGEVDDSSNSDTCASDSNKADIIVEKDFVTIANLEMPDTVQCGSSIQISGDVWNIGSRDQDNIELKIVSSGLDIEEYVQIGDLDSLNDDSFNLDLKLPEDVTAGTYVIKFSILDEDGDVYQADHDDELSMFSKSIVVLGDCSSANVDVKAVLQEGGQAGKLLIVKATLINTGTKMATYTLNAQGYANWADSASLSQNTLALGAGESEDVLITLDVSKDAIGEKTFNLEVLSESSLVANQPVSVEITKRSGITGFSINQSNWHLWGIGFLNLILVIVIILIAIRVSRK